MIPRRNYGYADDMPKSEGEEMTYEKVLRERLTETEKELAAANALLARVFGESRRAHICHLRNEDYTYCNLLSDVCEEHTRRPDCPYLPFEVSK